MEYGNLKDLNEKLLYKRIVKWEDNELTLDDGTLVSLEESEQDCCAMATGTFTNVELDAVITNVEIGEQIDVPDDDTRVSEVKVTLFHNQNPIAQGEMTADAGNGGYYYSVGSFVVDGIHYPIVEA